MKTLIALILALLFTVPTFGKPTRSSSSTKSTSPSTHVRASSPGTGTGSKSASTHVRSYTKKDGTHVEAHRRSTPDKSFENNWSTKPNSNPYTGKSGTRVTSPKAKDR